MKKWKCNLQQVKEKNYHYFEQKDPTTRNKITL